MTNESQPEPSSTSSEKTEPSARPDDVLALGRKLVRELGLEQSTDTLGRWMAHHVAGLMAKTETANGAEEHAAERECFEAILALWKHRSTLPHGARPFEKLEPVIRAVASLDPEDETPRIYRSARPPMDRNEDPEQRQLLELIDGIDYSAKVLIGFYLSEAAEAAIDQSQEWVELAKGLGEDADVASIVLRFVTGPNEPNKEPDLHDALRKLLAERLKRLRGFIGLAERTATTLASRLEALPPASDETDDEILVLSSSPILPELGQKAKN